MKNLTLLISFLGHLIITLISSLILCLYLEPLVRLVGFYPSLSRNSLDLWLSLGMIVVSLELLYRALLQFIFSAPFNQTNFIDSLSFLPFTLFFVGEPLLEKYNFYMPPILRCLSITFVVLLLHTLMKLLTLFSATFGKPNNRYFSFLWILPLLTSVYLSTVATIAIKNALFTDRLTLVDKHKLTLKEKNFITKVPEGGFFLTSLPIHKNCEEIVLTFMPESKHYDSEIFIYIFNTYSKDKYILKLNPPIHSAPPQWVEISLPCDLLPSNESFIITWSSYNLPDWIIKNGLQPTISVNSYTELKSLIFDDKIYTCPPNKFLLLGGPYEIIRCVEQKNN